jgi:hypothetical protein
MGFTSAAKDFTGPLQSTVLRTVCTVFVQAHKKPATAATISTLFIDGGLKITLLISLPRVSVLLYPIE